MKKCVSILVGVLAVIAAAAAVLVALDRFRKQTDEDPNDFEDCNSRVFCLSFFVSF